VQTEKRVVTTEYVTCFLSQHKIVSINIVGTDSTEGFHRLAKVLQNMKEKDSKTLHQCVHHLKDASAYLALYHRKHHSALQGLVLIR
jgi:hypothetical protein